jgi:hypothetical protein
MLARIAAIILLCGGLTPETALSQTSPDSTRRSDSVALLARLDAAFERKVLREARGRGTLIDIHPGRADRPTAIFVHGMAGAASDLTGVIQRAIDAGDTVTTFAYDDKFRTLEDSSRDLARAIDALMNGDPARTLRLVAHSMGGRVALGALASLQRDGRLTGEVELNLIASPIAGVPSAMFSQVAPAFLPWIRPSRGMASASGFQRMIDRLVLPSNVTVNIFVGGKDEVFDHSTDRYRLLIEKLRATVMVFAGATHMTILDEVARLPAAFPVAGAL